MNDVEILLGEEGEVTKKKETDPPSPRKNPA
jgi:hypothetical protein